MRIESLNLAQAAQNRSKVHVSGNAVSGNTTGKANEAASRKESFADKIAAADISDTGKAAKNTLHGLENAISRLEEKDKSNHGIEHALQMLTRNLARGQGTTQAATDSATPATDAGTAGSSTTGTA